MNKSIPNSILPFYSVDMMLKYLKHPQRTLDLGISDVGSNESMENKIHAIYFMLLSTKDLHITINEDEAYDSKRGGGNTACGKKEQVPSILFESEDSNKKESVRMEIKEALVTDGEGWEKLTGNVKHIVEPIRDCFLAITRNCPETDKSTPTLLERVSLVDRFKDHCIAVIMSEYKGGRRNEENLIRELKKLGSISEVYKYLVDQLWEKDATELLIRNKIQQEVRKNNTVKMYYGKLRDLMEDAVSSACRDVYKTIYDNASMIFIDEIKAFQSK